MYQKKNEKTVTEAVEKMMEQFTADLVHKRKFDIDELDIALKAFKESNLYKNTLAITKNAEKEIRLLTDAKERNRATIARNMSLVQMYRELAEAAYVSAHEWRQCEEGYDHFIPR